MSRFPFIVAVHLFLFKDNQVLLLRRFNTGYQDGNYSVPAGHVDGGESITGAMIREAQEEIGITLKPEELTPFVMHRIVSATEERVDFFFKCTQWSGEPQNCEKEKCDELRWYAIDALPDNLIPYVRAGLVQTQANILLAEFDEHSV